MAEMKTSASVRREKTKKSRAARFRLLPLVIFFCVLMLSVRVGVVWRNLVLPQSAGEQSAVAVTPVQAQSSAMAAEAKAGSLSSKITQAVSDAEKNRTQQPENKESSRLPFPEPGGFKKQKRTDFSSSSLKAPDASAETTETLLKEKIIVLLKKTNNEAVSQIFTL